VVIDAGGIVRAVRVEPGQPMTTAEVIALVRGAFEGSYPAQRFIGEVQ
jgi:hypothetical protein